MFVSGQGNSTVNAKTGAIAGKSILHIITRLDRGGSAEIVLDLARILRDRGARVDIGVGVTDDPQEDLAAYAARTGVGLHHIPGLVRNISPLKDLTAFWNTFSLIRRLKPDIVHTHTSKAGIIGRFAARLAGVSRIVHTPHGHIFYGYYGAFVTAVFVLLERLAALVSRKITILTEQGLRDHVAKKIGPESLFTVIPSGVDIEHYSSGDGMKIRRELGCGDTPLVGWAGRLAPVKDCCTFIRAAALVHADFPEVTFVVAGNGEEFLMLKGLRDKAGLHDCLVFLGDRTDIPDIMASLDVFVLSSVNEGFGRVLVEAMAAGAAVVSTGVGGTVDVVEDNVSGILVPPSDPQSLADAVGMLLGNRNLRERLIASGRERAKHYDIRITVNSFEAVYEELLSG